MPWKLISIWMCAIDPSTCTCDLGTCTAVQFWSTGTEYSCLCSQCQHLPVIQQRTEYKVCVLIYKCLHQTAPTYLAEMCTPVSTSVSQSHLHSAVHGSLAVLCSRTVDKDAFSVSGLTLWNSLLLTMKFSWSCV